MNQNFSLNSLEAYSSFQKRASQMAKKLKFWTFQAKPASVRVISFIFVCKSSFIEISMIKMDFLDQSKQILLILKIEKSKIQKSKICKLNVYYS